MREKFIGLIYQILKFTGISGIGWMFDFVVYTLLNHVISAMYANMVSATIGVSFVFWVSVRKTFRKNIHRISLKWKYFIYLCYQVVAITAASIAIGYIQNNLFSMIQIAALQQYRYIIVKLLVTPFTLCINFLVMKMLIEKV